MNIKGISKAKILSALYNNAKVQGMGFIHFISGDMSTKEAQSMLDSGQTYFDYVKGRVMKIDLSKETELDTRLYNRDNGHNAAENIINKIISQESDTTKENKKCQLKSNKLNHARFVGLNRNFGMVIIL